MTTVEVRTEYLLPPEAYYSPEWYAREQTAIFGRTWNLVGYTCDVPAPGSWMTGAVADEPVLVARGDDGVLRAFTNMCRHRGMVLASGRGCGSRTLRCSYHGWEFGLDGSLARVPQRAAQFPDLDADQLGLVTLGVGEWGGLVFVNPDAAHGPSFDEWLGDFPTPEFVGDYPLSDLVEVWRSQHDLACNWKLYIENHIDCYHLWYLHESTLDMYDHHALRYRSTGPHWACDEPLRPGRTRRRNSMPLIEPLPPEEEQILRANLLFPNVPYTSGATTVTTYQVIPTGPESCRLDLRVRAMPGARMSESEIADGKKVLVEEDGRACERMQAVMHSPRFQVGPLAEVHERPIMQFHRSVLEHLA